MTRPKEINCFQETPSRPAFSEHGALGELFLDGRKLLLRRGEELFAPGDTVRSGYLVIRGRVGLVRHLADGKRLPIQAAAEGQLLAEASIFHTTYHCAGIAFDDAEVAVLPKERLLAALERTPQLTMTLLKDTALALTRSRTTLELHRIRHAHQRILAWIEVHADADGRFQIIGSVKAWAETMGLTHEAVYRALRRLEKLGKIRRECGGMIKKI